MGDDGEVGRELAFLEAFEISALDLAPDTIDALMEDLPVLAPRRLIAGNEGIESQFRVGLPAQVAEAALTEILLFFCRSGFSPTLKRLRSKC